MVRILMWWLWMLLLLLFLIIVVTGMEIRRHVDMQDTRLRVLFERHNITDCDTVNVPCVTDAQCRDNCVSGLVMHCNDGGFCSAGTRYVLSETEKCDPARGLVVVFNAVENLGFERVCVSLYRDVIEDGGELRPYVCEHGVMNVSLEERPFSVEDCECDDGYTKFVYTQGAYNRPTPVCLTNEQGKLFSRIYTPI
ncbi:pif-3 [Clostera anastomosis granulovirus A]|uniref:Pif-3 n=1 Tax=Clostera anastomosis granulovirus A TaxID=1986289 RepID=U5KBK6_9BBAC|nr:pif-3 [Clostera anastomosis granulovirus Henan]AGQ20293.1 pif-3 [Clostera anastomosis granulovirus Henan]